MPLGLHLAVGAGHVARARETRAVRRCLRRSSLRKRGVTNQTTVALIGLGIWFALGVLWCVAVTVAARLQPARTLWFVWAILFTGIVLLLLPRIVRDPFMETLGRGYAVFMVVVLFGAPSAVALAAALRRAKREPRTGRFRDHLVVVSAFLLSLFVAAVLVALPDIIALTNA